MTRYTHIANQTFARARGADNLDMLAWIYFGRIFMDCHHAPVFCQGTRTWISDLPKHVWEHTI